MSRKTLAVLVLATLGVLGYAGIKWTTSRQPSANAGNREEPGSLQNPEDTRPADPEMSLQINGLSAPTVYEGTPLLVSIRIANVRAANAALENASDDAAQRSHRPRPIPLVRLGGAGTTVSAFVHFSRQMPDATDQPLAWPLRSLDPPAPSVVLDADHVLEINYALDPAATTGLPAGEYRLMAVLDVRADAPLPDGAWRGRVRSEPVILTVLHEPGTNPSAALTKNVDMGTFFFRTKDPSRALGYAQQAVAADATSIAAQTLLGDVKHALGDRPGAVAAYSEALDQFYKQSPNSYEPPQYLIAKLMLSTR